MTQIGQEALLLLAQFALLRTQRENIVLYDSMGARCGGEQREKQHRVRNEQRENARIAIYDPGS